MKATYEKVSFNESESRRVEKLLEEPIEKLQTIKPENWIKEMSIQKLIAPHSIISYSIIFLILFKDFIPNNPINYNTLKEDICSFQKSFNLNEIRNCQLYLEKFA